MNAKKEEMLRRLDAMQDATRDVTAAELDFAWCGESAIEPFYRWPTDGEISVIYDRDGKVSHRVVR